MAAHWLLPIVAAVAALLAEAAVLSFAHSLGACLVATAVAAGLTLPAFRAQRFRLAAIGWLTGLAFGPASVGLYLLAS